MRNIMDRRMVCSLGGVFLVVSGVAFAGPTDRADPFNGKELAKKLCASCHIVDSQQQEALADVPSFNEIANKEGQTAAAIMGHIIRPQHPMPAIPLTQDELSDLAAYIFSMRKSG